MTVLRSRWLSLRQFVETYHVSNPTVKNWIRLGYLEAWQIPSKAHKVGRYFVKDPGWDIIQVYTDPKKRLYNLPMLTTKEVALIAGRRVASIRFWIRIKKLKGARIGRAWRFSVADIDNALAASKNVQWLRMAKLPRPHIVLWAKQQLLAGEGKLVPHPYMRNLDLNNTKTPTTPDPRARRLLPQPSGPGASAPESSPNPPDVTSTPE